MKKVLVSGATGYLGGKVLRHLDALGCQSVALVRAESVETSLEVSRPRWRWPLETEPRADVLLLLGTVFSGHTRAGEASRMARANIDWPVRVAEAFLAGGGRQVVAAGTCWEDVGGASRQPANAYAASKVAARTMLDAMCRECGAALAWLSIADTFGIDDRRGKIFEALRHAIGQGAELPMSAGGQVFDPLPADEAARALAVACALEPAKVAGRWSIAGREPASLRDKVERYCEIVGRSCPAVWGARAYRFGEPFEVNWAPSPPWWRPAMDYARAVREMEALPGGLLFRPQE